MASSMISTKKMADKWGVTTRRINQLCNANEIKGACKIGGRWTIPSDAEKPAILRLTKSKNGPLSGRLLPCPIGITSYKEVSSECYYVDKTLLIKDLLDDHSKVSLFTRPRRFGKTLAMDMLKTFFEKSDEDTSVYFTNRAIWSCGKSYRAYQGAYPVIFLSFKDAHQSAWNEMYESLILSLRNEFKRHEDLLNSPSFNQNDRDYFKKIVDGRASKVEYQASLGELSRMLLEAYSTRVIVIIDEYDTPIQQGFSCHYYNEVIEFMRNLFSSVLKDNPALEFGVLTGILRIAKESLFSGLNNIVVNTILDEKYSRYFGFTSQEVAEMANYYGKADKLDEIADWYDGYLFGNSEIYNPWSVINYFNNACVPKAFWSRTSSNDVILDLVRDGEMERQEALTSLLQDKPLQATVDTDIIYPEIERSEDALYSFLLMTGYLKVGGVEAYIGDVPLCNLLIPNKEIKSVFKKEIIDHLSNKLSPSVMRRIQVALKLNNPDLLQESLRQYLLESASSFDVGKEDFYHGMMLGLLSVMSEEYAIRSNREGGEGRFDILLQPRVKGLPGILMEFKAGKDVDEDGLSKLAESAIKQIREKNYASEMDWLMLPEIDLYGIAFSKKKAKVVTKRLLNER